MRRSGVAVFVVLTLSSVVRPDADAQTVERTIALTSPVDLEARGVKVEAASYRGRTAVHGTGVPVNALAGLAVLKGSTFKDGTIEVDVAGAPEAGAFEGARGFVGIAFRLNGDKYECFYLRPTNGRSDDQLRRNHSTQYVSEPAFPWQKLRQDSPGVYESYVDLEPGAWTKVKIVVAGTKARLFVHDAPQPALVVNDLKLGETQGAVALWIGPGTEAHFSNLRITR